MAQKRMFDKSIIDSDSFLEMPLTTQALYFHLNMRADDDGFVDNWKSIMRIIGAKDDDIKVLFSKQYIIPFDTGVIVIRHWKINNYLQKDRKKATRHLKEIQQLKEVNGEYYLIEDGEISNILSLDNDKEIPEWQIKRDKAYKESSLPYSFLYKIRNAFNNERCPLCNNIMKTSSYRKYIPTIQHLLPISKGGKHELDNIAVICFSCNSSIRDKEIKEKLNNKLVIKKWEDIIENDKYLSRLTSVSIDKNSIDKNSIEEKEKSKKEKEKYFENEKLNSIFLEFLDIRKKIKAVNSDRAIKTLINKLDKYDDDTKIKMIENSIVNSWKDIYELKKENKKESFNEMLDRLSKEE